MCGPCTLARDLAGDRMLKKYLNVLKGLVSKFLFIKKMTEAMERMHTDMESVLIMKKTELKSNKVKFINSIKV